MRLIDADELFDHISHLSVTVTGLRSGKGILSEYAKHYRESVLRTVDEAPTVDAVPVVHGEWKVLECDGGEPGGYAPYIDVECSNCGLTVGLEQGQYDWAYGDPFPWKCCPFCEAKMDGGNEE